MPGFHRAACELQGYAYDTETRGARLAREVWKDPQYAARLEREAADLKRRFNRDFWVEDGEYFALALDADGAQVDALASNIGHLLWSGIVDKRKAKAVARRLMSPRLYSGWGVRTLADGQGRYNAIGYHVGTIWPFDNAFIAWGLRRWASRRRRRASPPASSAPRSSSTAACRRRSGATNARGRSTRSSTRRRAARRPGRRARRCCSCARCSAWSRSATTSSSTPPCRGASGASSSSTSPAAGGRVDAFGRGTIDVGKVEKRARPLGVATHGERSGGPG